LGAVMEDGLDRSAGCLEAIWIKRAHRGPMDAVDAARFVRDLGLRGNADQGGRRQVTVVEREVFEILERELGREVDPAWRRANLMVSGVRLEGSRGRVLRVGELRLRVWGETRPCERMDEALPGLRRALEPGWRGGVSGVVLNDAAVQLGDSVGWEPESGDPG
jgi:MOSC domain-containing protein YiiM